MDIALAASSLAGLLTSPLLLGLMFVGVLVGIFMGIAPGVGGKLGLFDVAHNSHNGGPGGVGKRTANAFSNRVLVRPVLAGEVLVNDDHRFAACRVVICKRSAANQ